MSDDPDTQYVDVGGHRVRLTHLDKVMYPATGTTKADVIAYLTAVADALIPLAADRPATRKRWIDGVEEPSFFQKDLGAGTPEWVQRRTVQHRDHTNDYPLVNNLETLTWLAQTATLEVHVPQWRFAADGTRANPDRMVLDLDPGEGVGLAECAEVARWLRAILQGMQLECFPVTSGSKGIHLYARLDGHATSDEVSATAHELARAMAADHPDLVVSEIKKSLRTGKVFIDWSQNSASKTTVCPYSLRGRERPWVAAPRTWEELDEPGLRHLEAFEVVERLKSQGDPLAGLRPEPPDRLAPYRAKRRAGRTPEPVPPRASGDSAQRPARPRAGSRKAAGHAAGSGKSATSSGRSPQGDDEGHPAEIDAGPRYVVHEHHARRLHWDLRLEHDGALACWAIPKGLPGPGDPNRLAVHTEDHPLEYLDFEGTIPRGEYGAGAMSIWDSGVFAVSKWRADEVIVTLESAEEKGSRAYALIRTESERGDDWLIHAMARASAAKSGARQDVPASPQVHRPDAARQPALAPRPMLAVLAPAGTRLGPGWSFEMKWDGMRALCVVSGGRVAVFSRSGRDVTGEYPELAHLADRVVGDCVIDGEIVAFGPGGRPDFGLLQQRFGVGGPQAEELAARVPVDYVAFDLLAVAETDLCPLPYTERRALLTQLVSDGERVHVPGAFAGDQAAAERTAAELGLEGVMAKRADSPYRPGARSDEWLKLKRHDPLTVTVVGWRPSTTEPGTLASLLVALPDLDQPDADAGLRYAGRVGAGLTDRERRAIPELLAPERQPAPPCVDVPLDVAREAIWVRPDRRAEVYSFGRTAGNRLRHPVWKGWRPD